MSSNEMQVSEKKIEAVLSAVGAKISNATDLSTKAQSLLIEAQGDISDLYISLGELLGTDCKRDNANSEIGINQNIGWRYPLLEI